MTTKPYNKDNLILIGMPGAGKSTIGIVLAKIIGYTFIDSKNDGTVNGVILMSL